MPRSAMETPTLATYPWVTFRLACAHCKRRGRYRTARLAEKYGAETSVDNVVRQLAADCPHWRKSRHMPEGCGVHLPDLRGTPRPPDNPAQPFSVVKGGKDR